jgi:glycerol transport system permease protein
MNPPEAHAVLVLYLVFALLPIYWMVNMSFKTNEEILSGFSCGRSTSPGPTTHHLHRRELVLGLHQQPDLRGHEHGDLDHVALPAAYAFSRYRFLGDKHVFFWLLTNRMTPPAVFLLPFFQLYTTLGLMDTHIAVALAHLLFNVPLAVWIWKASCRHPARDRRDRLHRRLQLPALLPDHLPAADQGRRGRGGVLLLHVQLGGAAAGAHADQRQRQAHRGDDDAHGQRLGMDWATLAAAGVLTIVPGAIVIWFVRHYIAKGFAMGRV